jgi:endonuclease YncB( thermonuclease family)
MINHNKILPIPYRFSVRIMGIDAPEIKGETLNEKICAIKSREELSNKILGKIIRLEIIQKPEKWGRILANVFLDDENIGEWMINNNLAIPYSGKTKVKAKEWLDE